MAKGRGDAPASPCTTSGIATGIAAGIATGIATGIAAGIGTGIAAGIACACQDSATVGQSPQDLGGAPGGPMFVVYVGLN